MSEIRDLFVKDLDTAESGLRGQISALSVLLQRHDRETFEHLAQHEVHLQFFALRWLTTLLSREFDLPDTVRLWDSLLADPQRFRFMLHVACAMIIVQRDTLLSGDFAVAISLL